MMKPSAFPVKKRMAYTVAAMSAMALVACGGGGGGAVSGGSAQSLNSSGVITAFGSVFVNGHEFNTNSTSFVDDDTGATASSAAGMEVGMLAEVVSSSGSTTAATELHTHPLVRGYVDTVDTANGLLTVMGQAIQVNTSTQISDRRACALSNPTTCTPISGISGLTATQNPTPGTYVSVDGYLFSSGSANTNVVATLVSVRDPSTTSPQTNAAFKAEGVLSVSGGTYSIGGLTLGVTNTTCKANKVVTPCSSVLVSGQVLSVVSNTAPTLPATSFSPVTARAVSKITATVAGQSIELEGAVSSVSGSTIVVRGTTVNVSSGLTIPSVGDVVEIVGTLNSTAQAVTASSIKVKSSTSQASSSSTINLGLTGHISTVAAGTSANTYTLSILGKTVTVNADTRLMDRSIAHWDNYDPASVPNIANPFNITTFQTYISALSSPIARMNVQSDVSGNLIAKSLVILPATTASSISGLVDASPAPTGGIFYVDGIQVAANTATIVYRSNGQSAISANDVITAAGAYSGGVLTATQVVDGGAVQSGRERHGGEF